MPPITAKQSEELQAAAADADGTAQTITGNFTRLTNELVAMERALVGGAGTAFQSVQGEARIHLSKIVDALTEMAADIRTGDMELSAADDSGQQMISSIIGQLGGAGNAGNGAAGV